MDGWMDEQRCVRQAGIADLPNIAYIARDYPGVTSMRGVFAAQMQNSQKCMTSTENHNSK